MDHRRRPSKGRKIQAMAGGAPAPAPAPDATGAPAPLEPAPPSAPASPRPFVIGKWSIPYAPGVLLACLAAAFLFLLFGPYSNFGPLGYYDPWFYTGYFMHLSYLVRVSGATYYLSRLPWILPGALVFKIARPEAATVILNALILAASAASLYFIVSRHYGKRPATLACLALATNPYFMYSVAWDYPDGPAVAYSFIALAFLLRPTGGRLPGSFLGGVFLAFSGFTNMAGAPALLAIMAVPLWLRRRSPKELAREIFWVACGGLAGAAFLAPFGRVLLGRFAFFQPQLDQIHDVASHPGYLEHMWGTGYAWLPTAYRLAPFLFLQAVGGLALILGRKRSPVFVVAYLALTVDSALFVLGEFALHNVGMRVAYGSTYMLTPAMAFAGLLIGECWSPAARWDRPPGLSWRWAKTAVPALLAILAALFSLALPVCFPAALRAAPAAQIWGLTATLAIAAGVFLAAPIARKPVSSLIVCCLIFAALFFGPACDSGISYPFRKDNAKTFRTLVSIVNLVDSGTGPARRLRFWYDQQEPAIDIYHSAASFYLWEYADCTAQVPSAPVEALRDIFQADTTFVHLTLDPSKIAVRESMLASRGVSVGDKRHWKLPSASGTIHVVMEDVTGLSGLH